VVTTIPDNVLRSVLDRFGLPDARLERSFEASTRNDNLLLSSRSGERFVLRRYRRNRDVPRIEFQLRFQQWLFEAGYPVPEVIDAGSASLVLTDAGPFGLCTFVEGDYYDYDRPAHRVEAGRRLAEFHTLTQRFPEPAGEYELVQPIREWWTDPERELSDLESFFDEVDITAELAQVRAWLQELHSNLSLEQFDSLPGGWIHNDYHGRNVLFRDDQVSALLDFDKVQTAPYAVEIASAIFMFGRFVPRVGGHPACARPRVLGRVRGGSTARRSGRRDGLDPLAAFRANVSGQHARRANAASLVGHI
jgi:Ser/Thr protein kinase RdoA (MazF antagonist)